MKIPLSRRRDRSDVCWSCLPPWPAPWAGMMMLGCTPAVLLAQPTGDTLVAATERIEVIGRAEQRIGNTVAASEGSVAGIDLKLRPLLRTAELLEAVPGLIAVQHSGGGKANQYFLRGFNLDHGSDFSLLVDEVPMNFRTHGHGQGYLDVGSLIPEVVTRIDYRKGPYRADAGDFSLVGMASATTADRFEQAFASLQVGRFGYQRAVAGTSWTAGDTDLLLTGEGRRYDGPWELPERLRHGALYAKATHDTDAGTLRASLSLYHATWRPTEQIPDRAVGTVIADVFGALDPDLKGHTDRAIASLRLDGEAWRVSAYVQRYDWKLLSNFTFFLDDPVNGDQLEQSDRRRTYGGRVERRFKPADGWRVALGAETRFDDISAVGLYKAVAGTPMAPRGLFAVEELSGALYTEANVALNDELTVFGGLRADHYRFETQALAGSDSWSGKVADSMMSPKLGASYQVGGGFALYINWGRGFHSNDARGVTAPVDPAPGLVRGTGSELGARYERPGLNLAATLWRMQVDSDLIFVGDSGAVEPAGATRRRGIELSAFWKPVSWLAFDAALTASHARFVDAPSADRVPGALDNTGELGATAIFDTWNASMRIRHLGPHALVEDNSVRSSGTTLVNFRTAWTPQSWGDRRVELFAELLNAFDSRRKDVDYFYASRLAGEPVDGVEGRHSRVVEPRSLRVGVRVGF